MCVYHNLAATIPTSWTDENLVLTTVWRRHTALFVMEQTGLIQSRRARFWRPAQVRRVPPDESPLQ